MTFSLIYTAKGSGNRWYWAEPGFSRQASRKHEWPTTDAISLARLQKTFATAFARKDPAQFAILDNTTQTCQALTSPLTPPASPFEQLVSAKLAQLDLPPVENASTAATAKPFVAESLVKTLQHSPYLLSMITPQGRRFWSQGQKQFLPTLTNTVSHWDTPVAAVKHLQLALGKGTLNQAVIEGPLAIYNGITNQVETEMTAAIATALKDWHIRVATHFTTTQHQTVANQALSHPQLNETTLAEYDPEKLFKAISYVLDALALKTTVDHDLAFYDREVTQDYLHAVEFTPLTQIDAPGLIAALQALRQRRRQVKDLSLLLNAFDAAFDTNRFWQALNVSATGIKYQVRSAQAAAALPTLCQLPTTPEPD